MSNGKRALLTLASLLLATAIWLPCVHFFFKPDIARFRKPTGIPPAARELAARHLALWSDPRRREVEILRMHASNAEWDFMGRTFLVLALANMSLREPGERARYLDVIDRIIDETVKVEADEGMYHFLMPYAHSRPYIEQPARSLFVDGEIALMMAARRLVEEKPEYRAPMRERLNESVRRMKLSPVLLAESYPNECWLFDHAVTLAALRIGDALDGEDHSAFCKAWIDSAKANFVEPKTGLLISVASTRGTIGDGPEGSSLWTIVGCLDLVDPDFSRDQYQRAKTQLARGLMGFAWASEWPREHKGHDDIDSGPTIPILEVSAGSSGTAFIAAALYDDQEFLGRLLTTLQFAAFPIRGNGELRFAASNQVGDAVVLYQPVVKV